MNGRLAPSRSEATVLTSRNACFRLWDGWRRAIAVTLYRPLCFRCERILALPGERVICSPCLDQVEPVRGHICGLCGKPLPYPFVTCGECLLDPPAYRRHLSFGVYDGVLRDLVLRYKYGGERRLKRLLAAYLLDTMRRFLKETPHGVVAVPEDRGRRRPFAPVLDLARIIARELDIPLLKEVLIKSRSTPAQAGLTMAQRKVNVRGAFALTVESPLNGTLILIDDVYTTGSTMRACAAALMKDPVDVWAFSLARSL